MSKTGSARKTRLGRLLALLLALSLLLGVTAFGEDTGDPKPALTLVAVGVEGKYVELGLSFQAPEGGTASFRSAGMTVSFDPSLLSPVDWSGQSLAGYDSAADWDSAVAVPTKGPDELSGKTAYAYPGRLTLLAEAPRPLETYSQELPAFEDSGTTTIGGLAVLNPKTAGTPAAQSDEGEGGTGSEPEPASAAVSRAEQLVVVRFQLVGSATMADALASLDILTGESAKSSYLGDAAGYSYYPGAPAQTSGVSQEADLRILRAETGTTYFSGGGGGGSGPADPSDFITIVFVDWDGTTILGSTAAPKNADATQEVEAFTESLMSPESHDRDSTKTDYYIEDDDYPLTHKRGYSFYGWLPYEGGDYPFTHCGKALDASNRVITLDDPTADQLQDFSAPSGSIAVKACYKSNDELYYNTQNTGLNTYTITAEYSRVNFTSIFMVTVTYKREKTLEDGTVVGVPRLVEPMLRAIYSGSYNFFSVENVDVGSYTAYPASTLTNLQFVLVDFYNATNRVNASTKSNYVQVTNGVSATDPEGFRHMGTLGRINEVLAAGEESTLTAAHLRAYAGLTYTDLDEARSNLRKGWLNKNSADGTEATLKPENQWVGLTFDEMNYAIANGGALPPAAGS